MASVSKQFTAASIVLAAEQGFLSLDDDVRKYIPELPSYGHTITLRQMLHHTSGLRDFLALTYLAGRDISALSSSDDVLKLIVRQKGLNNVPGEEFVYSNTNYFLLGIVVKRATGKSLAEFAAANIFRPLGMTKTLFYDDNSVVVPNRVAAYDPGKRDGFQRRLVHDFRYCRQRRSDERPWMTSSSGIGTSTPTRSERDHLSGNSKPTGCLNNGHPINYGLGLWLGEYRGLKTVEHSGGTFGYRTELLRFPEQRFSVVVLCNVANADVEGFARQISDLYLEKELKSEANRRSESGSFPILRPSLAPISTHATTYDLHVHCRERGSNGMGFEIATSRPQMSSPISSETPSCLKAPMAP